MAERIIDLSFPIHEGMTTFPTHWHPFVEITQLGRHGLENRETRKIVMGTHTGTHCDAPRHFIPGGATIDQIPLDVFVGDAVVLDFSDLPEKCEITPAMLDERLKGRRPQRLILRFDWCKKISSFAYYNDHPFLSEESATWLMDNGLRLLAMDTPQPDNPVNGRTGPKDAPNHKIMLGRGAVLVEYLCNLAELRQDEVFLMVMPLKITNGDGAPARVAALDRS